MSYRSAARDLGPLERSFASPRPVRGLAIFWLVFGLPGIALLTGFQSERGEVFAGDRSTNGAIGVVLVAIAIACSVMALRKATLAVDLHANGLRWREAGITRDIGWDEIVEIRGAHTRRLVAGAEVARTNVYRITLDTGSERVATSMLGDVRALAERIETELLSRLLPKTRERIERGETVVFGPLTVDPKGAAHGDQRVEWSELEGVTVENGTLIVRGPKPIAIEWSRVPNARVLLAVLEERTASLSP